MTQSERMKFMMNNNKLVVCLKNEHFRGFGPLSLQVLQKFLTPHFTVISFPFPFPLPMSSLILLIQVC